MRAVQTFIMSTVIVTLVFSSSPALATEFREQEAFNVKLSTLIKDIQNMAVSHLGSDDNQAPIDLNDLEARTAELTDSLAEQAFELTLKEKDAIVDKLVQCIEVIESFKSLQEEAM